MIDRRDRATGRKRHGGSEAATVDAQGLAIEALTFFAGDADEAGRFFAWSGLEPEGLRRAAAADGFAAALLDYFADNLRSLERFCGTSGRTPDEVMRLHESLRTRGLSAHDDL